MNRTVALALCALLFFASCRERREVVLWAWERGEDLRFVTDREFNRVSAVAYWAGSVEIDDRVTTRFRHQPLSLAATTPRFPVIRIAVAAKHRALDQQSVDETARFIAKIARDANAKRLQIDYDARRSERFFYRDLLRAVRRSVPRDTTISITALTSWCYGDRWLDALDADEIVPMYFDMGDDARTVELAAAKGLRPDSRCRANAGLDTSSTLAPTLGEAQTLFVFNRKPWQPAAVRQWLERNP